MTVDVTGLVHQILLAFWAGASGIRAVVMVGLHGGPHITAGVTLYHFLEYCLLVIAAILALRVLVPVPGPMGLELLITWISMMASIFRATTRLGHDPDRHGWGPRARCRLQQS